MQTPEEFAASLLDDWRLDSVIKKIEERDLAIYNEGREDGENDGYYAGYDARREHQEQGIL